MSFIKFGEWLPDLPDVVTPGLTVAKNVIPSDGSYRPLKDLNPRGDALPARCQGAYAASLGSGSVVIYAGTADALYKRNGSAWDDVSSAAYSTVSGDLWGFTQYNDEIVATNFQDAMQIDEVGGAGFSDIAGAPKAKRVGVIRNFVFAGDVEYGAFGHVPHAVQWCAIDDPTDWPIPFTNDATSKQSSREELNAEYGPVNFIADGEAYGLVFQERGITRFTYIGGNTVFQVQTFERTRGAYAPWGAVQVGKVTYFLALDGFFVTDGFDVKDIGGNRVNTWFLADADPTYLTRITTAVDTAKNIVVWSYASNEATGGIPDKMIIYNYREDKWSYGEQVAELVLGGRSPGYTLEEMDQLGDLDSIAQSLDSSAWTGGYTVLQAFSSSHELGEFNGATKLAELESAEVALNGHGRAYVHKMKPVVEAGDTVTVQLGTRQDTADAVTWGTEQSLHPRNKEAHFRSDAYYHRARVKLTGGFDSAVGIHYFHFPSGEV